MKEPNWESCNEEEVWKFVGWHLAKNGIESILVGGAVAAIYSDGVYQSGDLDFVLKTYVDEKIADVMGSIGFKNQGGRHYIRPNCEKFVEFMFGPAGIGDDIGIVPDSKKVEGQTLYIYSPTDCIRDRLASYIHFKARECLDQAVLVAQKYPFNKKKVKDWCASEGAPEAYEALVKKLGPRKWVLKSSHLPRHLTRSWLKSTTVDNAKILERIAGLVFYDKMLTCEGVDYNLSLRAQA